MRAALTASVLGVCAGVLGKIARDVTLLSQTEVAEVRRGVDAGGSSAMAHKHNPVASVAALACVTRVPGRSWRRCSPRWSRSISVPPAPGRRNGGPSPSCVGLVGSAAAWTRELIAGLRVDPARMAVNLAAAPTAGEPLPAGTDALIDRALAAHEARRR